MKRTGVRCVLPSDPHFLFLTFAVRSSSPLLLLLTSKSFHLMSISSLSLLAISQFPQSLAHVPLPLDCK